MLGNECPPRLARKGRNQKSLVICGTIISGYCKYQENCDQEYAVYRHQSVRAVNEYKSPLQRVSFACPWHLRGSTFSQSNRLNTRALIRLIAIDEDDFSV